MTGLTEPIRRWREQGRLERLDGVQLFYRVVGEDDTGLPWLVCFHGFPTSSWDFHALLPLLRGRYRVLVFDFPGYGLSDKPEQRDYSLSRQLDAVEALFRFLQIGEFELLAHDMGNSVACELLRRRESGSYPFHLRSLTLLNGGIYMDLHRPLLTQRLLRTPVLGTLTARLSSWSVFRRQYPRVYARPAEFDEEHYRSQWALVQHNRGRLIMHRIAGYMKERTRMGSRWTGPLHRLELPLRVIWGRQDPIAVFAIAQRLCTENPKADLTVLPECGHYPQLESPRDVSRCLVPSSPAGIPPG